MNRRILARAAKDLAEIASLHCSGQPGTQPKRWRPDSARLSISLPHNPRSGGQHRSPGIREWSVPGLPYVIPYRVRSSSRRDPSRVAYQPRKAFRVVAASLAHTPYDGSAKPFTIGLKPLDQAEWLEVDRHRDAYLAEKRRLYAEIPGKVFVAEARNGGRAAGSAGADRRPPPATFPGDSMPARASARKRARRFALASLLVQEDLVLMRRGEDGWRLAAASLCFPSSWSLEEKFGRPLQDIHTPVPGFGRGTRTADIIHRIFDNLAVAQPVERLNWSLQAGADLYQPLSNAARIDRAAGPAVALSRSRRRRKTPSSASSARLCASWPALATSSSPSAFISTRCRCWRGMPAALRSPHRLPLSSWRSIRPSSTTRGSLPTATGWSRGSPRWLHYESDAALISAKAASPAASM